MPAQLAGTGQPGRGRAGLVGAAPAAVFAVEDWGQTVATADPWPAAQLMYAVQLGAWVWNLAGFVALCLVFPDGLPPGHRRRIVCAAVACGVFVNAVLSFDPGTNVPARRFRTRSCCGCRGRYGH